MKNNSTELEVAALRNGYYPVTEKACSKYIFLTEKSDFTSIQYISFCPCSFENLVQIIN